MLRCRAATDSHERPGHRPGTEPALPQRREEVPLTGARAPEFAGAAGVNGSVRGSRQAQKGERAASRGREQSEPLAFPNRLARGGNLSVVFPTARGCWGGGMQREPLAAGPASPRDLLTGTLVHADCRRMKSEQLRRTTI